jgi:uncharacterized integral membrane protein
MYFVHVIQSRKGRAWAVLITMAIVGILIAVFVLLSGRSNGPFNTDQIYGLLD